MACKSFDSTGNELRSALVEAYQDHVRRGGGSVSPRELLDGTYVSPNDGDRQQQLLFAADELLDEQIYARLRWRTLSSIYRWSRSSTYTSPQA